jgi:hypothetical protein
MTKRPSYFRQRRIAPLIRGLMVAGVAVLAAACGKGTYERDPVEPIQAAPSFAETAILIRDNSPHSLVDVLHLGLQRH